MTFVHYELFGLQNSLILNIFFLGVPYLICFCFLLRIKKLEIFRILHVFRLLHSFDLHVVFALTIGNRRSFLNRRFFYWYRRVTLQSGVRLVNDGTCRCIRPRIIVCLIGISLLNFWHFWFWLKRFVSFCKYHRRFRWCELAKTFAVFNCHVTKR